jgi:hypothetical protein
MPYGRARLQAPASARYMLSTKYVPVRQYILYVIDMGPPTYDRTPAGQITGQGKAQLLLVGQTDWCQPYNSVAVKEGQGCWNQF